ncbi:MAG: SoxR reducing system RseC family protein [Cellvibrionaceae bacterium]
MLEENGKIVAIEDDCLWVETIQKTACGTCAAEKGCGTSVLGRYLSKANFIRVLLEGRERSCYSVGDTVKIGIPEDVVVKASLFVYLLPLAGLLLGAILGDFISGTDLSVLLGAVTGLMLGGAVVRGHAIYHRNNRRVQPVLLDGLEPVSMP